MIAALDRASIPPRSRVAALRQALRAGVPALPMLVIHRSHFDLQFHSSGAAEPTSRTATAGDFEARLEEAIEQEWRLLAAPLAGEIEREVLDAVASLEAEVFLVRSEAGDALATRLVRGRYQAIEAVRQAWASCVYHGHFAPQEPLLVVTSLRGGRDLVAIPPTDPGFVEPWVSMMRSRWGIGTSLWLRGEEGPLLADAGGPPVDTADPWGLAAANAALESAALAAEGVAPEAAFGEILRTRVLLGRIHNRLMRPAGPFEWVSLLLASSAGGEEERSFLQSCSALHPGSGERVLALARRTVDVEMQAPFLQNARPVSTDEPKERPRTQQLAGRCGNAGEATGTVHHAGRPTPAGDGFVLVCDRLRPNHAELLDRAAAAVEWAGSCFGIGALMARRRGLPHIYAVADAPLLIEGARVVVSGALGLTVSK